MDVMLLRMFQHQVLLQCKYFLQAASEVGPGLQARNAERVFYSLQNALNASANISKALWGQGGKLSENRKALRDSIGITESSVFRVVAMRNNFEHFDERLDRWWEKSNHHNNFDLSIGPRRAIEGAELIDQFRQFDPETESVIFWGEEFNLRSIVEEVLLLLPRLEAETKKPHWIE